MTNETPSAGSLYEDAKNLYVPYKTRVTDVQRDIWDREWQLTSYGDFPEACQKDGAAVDNTFRFVTSVYLSDDGAGVVTGIHRAAEELATRLSAHDWSDVRVEDVSASRTESVTVWASDESQHVETLMVNFDGGLDGNASIITLEALSTCGTGDALDLMDEMFPTLDTPPEPETITPSNEFRFGFDPAGEPVIVQP